MAKDQKASEKQKVQEMMPKYHAEAQRLAKERVKELLKAIKDEPLPDEKSLDQEHKKMINVEQRLARMLKPLDKVMDSKRLARKKKSPSKKTKKASKSVSKKKSTKKTRSSKSKKR